MVVALACNENWYHYLTVNIYSLLKSNTHNVNINYCKGHNGIEGNELADKLATGEISAEEVLNKYGR